MKNKLVGISIICVICIVVYFLYNSISKSEEKEDVAINTEPDIVVDPVIYDLTIEEVKRINENSNFLGCILLSDAPESAMIQEPNEFDRDGKVGYMCDSYNSDEKLVIAQIEINSADTHVFGISPDDDLDKAIKIMESEGYSKNNNHPPMYERFSKYHIDVIFYYSEDGQIIEIYIGVQDPAVIAVEPTF